jgi:hypothetical protein
MNDVTIPYPNPGVASFEQLDTWHQQFYLAGSYPPSKTHTFQVEQNQTLAQFQVVGLNARRKLVPATVVETITYYAESATVANPGSGGTNGVQTVTGTTGTGTKFQASVTIAGGEVVSVNSFVVEGSYSVAPAAPTVEPVTGASLTGAELNVVFAELVSTAAGIQAMGVMTEGVTTVEGQDTVGLPVFYSGNFDKNTLVWDASFAQDSDKFNAFRGAPSPTQIVIGDRQGS